MRVRAAVTMVLLGIRVSACGGSGTPAGTLDMRNGPNPTLRVKAPEGWISEATVANRTNIKSPDETLRFMVVTVNPAQAERDAYPNAREYSTNGKAVLVTDAVQGDGSIAHAFVTVGSHTWHVASTGRRTFASTAESDQLIVDLASSLEEVQ